MGERYSAIGLQYLHFGNQANFSVNGTGSGTGTMRTTVTGSGVVQGQVVVGSANVSVPINVNGSAVGSGQLNVDINAVMLNAAFRWDIENLHPYLGGGIGSAFADINGRANLVTTVGSKSYNINANQTISRSGLAGQVFVGTDVDLANNLYVGVQSNVFFTGTDLSVGGIGGAANLNSMQMSIMAHLGTNL